MTLRRSRTLATILLAVLLATPSLLYPQGPSTSPSIAVAAPVRTEFKRPPVRFEENWGQTDLEVRFVARTGDGMLFLTATEAVLRLPKHNDTSDLFAPANRVERPQSVDYATLRLRPSKGNPQARVRGVNPLPGVSHYLLGDDSTRWVTNVPSYAAVTYVDVYPGVDLVYYSNTDGRLEYDFRVAAGADPNPIAMLVEGAAGVVIDSSGDLLLDTAVGQVRKPAPLIFQDGPGGRERIAGGYRLLGTESGVSGSSPLAVAFTLGRYDASRELVIDPQLVYSTYLGGAAGNFDGGNDIAVDAAGNAYVTGVAESTDFPTRLPFDATGPARFSQNAFVTKLGPDGALLYSTFLGSSESDNYSRGNAIAVDATGAIYVAGTTGPGFPLHHAFQPTLGSFADAFVAKLSPDGAALVYASYLGGNQAEDVAAIALDGSGALYVTGRISVFAPGPVTFPLVNPVQPTYGGGVEDAFVAVVAPGGTSLSFSTFFDAGRFSSPPRIGADRINSLLVDPANGDILVSGVVEFPEGAGDPFLVRFRRSGPVTGLGGVVDFTPIVFLFRTIFDIPESIPDKAVEAWISNFFGSFGVFGQARGVSTVGPRILVQGLCAPVPPAQTCDEPGVVALLDQNLVPQRVVPVDLLRDFFVAAVGSDARGAIYVAGDTQSMHLHTVDPIQPTNGGPNDLVIVALAPDTYVPAFVTYLGGSGNETPTRIVTDALGNIYVTGLVTLSPNFPTTPGAFQRDLKGRNDAFIVKISPVAFPSVSPTPTVTPIASPRPTATVSPTSTPIGVIGGRAFSLQSNPGGPAVANWLDGTVETGYVGYRINLSSPGVQFFPANGAPQPDLTTYTDPSPTDIACYLTLVFVGVTEVRTSDAICLFRLPPSGNPPRNFRAQLNQSTMTALTWSPPQGGGQSGYSLQVIPLSGALPPPIALGAGATSYQHETGGQISCYLLTAQGPMASATDALCSYPNGSTIGNALRPGAGPAGVDQLRDRLAPLMLGR